MILEGNKCQCWNLEIVASWLMELNWSGLKKDGDWNENEVEELYEMQTEYLAL